jgi:hypothetical protein
MIQNSDFAYAQARIQARYGSRPGDAGWRRLEAVADLPGYLHGLRETSLRAWVRPLTPAATSHDIEAALRLRWSDYVRQISSFSPIPWRPAISWCSVLPALPAIACLQHDDRPPAWLEKDADLTAFEASLRGASTGLRASTTSSPPEPRQPLAAWAYAWCRLWPRLSGYQAEALARLQDAVGNHLQAMHAGSLRQSGDALRAELGATFTRYFRRYAGSVVAVFCHLGLTALDVERMRGGLAERRLFPPSHAARS